MRPAFVRKGFFRSPTLIKHFLAFGLITITLTASAFGGGDIQKVSSDDFRGLLKMGDRLVRRGEYLEAEKVFKRAIGMNPSHSGVKLKLALVHLKQRRLTDAYDLAFPIAKAEPKNSNAYAVLGAAMLSAGKFREARSLFVNALRINKKEALAWAGYGMLDFYENRILDSLSNLHEAVYHDPNEPDYFFALAQVSARAERYKEAADAYHQFLYISRNTDDDRRARIKGLINFLRYLGQKQTLYTTAGGSETSVPIQVVGNRPVIQLRVNDRAEPLRFVLDTGSGISVISQTTAKQLGIEPITRGGYAKGIGGDGRFEIVYGFLKQVEIGDIDIKNVPVYIRKFHNTGDDVDGYIGLSLISKFLTTIDYGALTFSLTQKDSDASADSGISLPLRLTSSGFLSGEVQLEGIEEPLNFIVDTGASVSVISDDVASADGISSFVKSEKMRVVGSAGIADDVPSFLLPRVSFGAHSRKSITAIALDLDTINESSGFEQAGILGGNFLRNYRMTFDFKNSKVTFVPINQEK
ncbi:MAG TPA: aspartyl protease family protein [Pyrinomonadaceae bacterium]|nr:aspartyl protease family protein [Pyrinomonadaceae bacterium]